MIIDTIIVTPVGATHLFITAHDSLHYDNTDADSDLAVRVTVLPGVLGDYNLNGTVDAADYTVCRDHLCQAFALTNENSAAATPVSLTRRIMPSGNPTSATCSAAAQVPTHWPLLLNRQL